MKCMYCKRELVLTKEVIYKNEEHETFACKSCHDKVGKTIEELKQIRDELKKMVEDTD